MEQKLIIRGRPVTHNDIKHIQFLLTQYWERGRTFISQELCRQWNWYQPNGVLKDMACRELLRRLEQKGLITLPPSKKKINGKQRKHSPEVPPHETHPLQGKIKDFLPIELKMVRGSPEETLYNGLIHQYHYLGYRRIVGPHLKYMAFIKGNPIACLSWGGSAWKVACRDQFIGWSSSARWKNLFLIIDNTRFLILPWIHIPYLASHILSQNIKILSSDWYRWYKYSPVLLETFVDAEKFKGTCYKAANWILVGSTKGRGKNDPNHKRLLSVKDVFVYPLKKEFKKILNNE